jgi:uncharacterized Rmd1/YagE family protein
MTVRSCSHAALVVARSLHLSAAEIRPPRSFHICRNNTTPSKGIQLHDGLKMTNRHLVNVPRAPAPNTQGQSTCQNRVKNEPEASHYHTELSPSSLDKDTSHIVHATTADFFPPPSLQEGLHIATTGNDIPSDSSSYSAPRLIKIQRKDVPDQKAAASDYRESLDGYKYRILKTPQLTNDILSAQVSGSDIPAINHMDTNEYDNYFTQSNHHAQTPLGLQPPIKGISDVLSSHWWKTLYNNVIKPPDSRNASSSSTHPFQSASMRNRRASILLEEIINNSQQFQEEEEKVTARIRVRSVQAASSIDVVAVLSKVFGGGVARTQQYDIEENNNSKLAPTILDHPLSEFFASSPPLRHVFGRTNIIIQLSPPPSDCPPSLAPSVPRYIAVYRFGSVVFFNVTTKEASKLLEQIKKHSVDPIAVGFERREFFEMGLQPQLETATGVITADRAMVRELDMNTVGVVSNIMGQTVALDWHNDTVDELLASFSNINTSVERTGNFSSMERHMLFQVVARNNSLFIDMVSKLGIKDRSDTAWHLSQYEGECRAECKMFGFDENDQYVLTFLWCLLFQGLHYGMREQFDLDERFRVSSVLHGKYFATLA